MRAESVDGRRMAETENTGSGRSPTSAVGEAETPNLKVGSAEMVAR
jgi:hypothetical protein